MTPWQTPSSMVIVIGATCRKRALEEQLTGPYFARNDPVMYRVKIPRAFWKVIALIHDETGELCATGYEMSQLQNLQPEEEFVFGALRSRQLNVVAQVPIRSIEARSGLRFGNLSAFDPLTGDGEGTAEFSSWSPLQTFEQIRFLS